MKRSVGVLLAAMSCLLLMGAANGAWLERVPPADHSRVSPFQTPQQQEDAAAAGAHVFYNNCAKCHGNDGMGKDGRPPVISDRVAHASDGDLFWLMKNGVPWRGMPAWDMLPARERWQLVTYLRALNGGTEQTPSSATPNSRTP